MEETTNADCLIKALPKKLDLMKIFQMILDDKHIHKNEKFTDTITIFPSEYMKQMSLTTEERSDFLLKSKQKSEFLETSVTFKVIPSIVIFQNFLPGQVYSVTLTIRNASNIIHSLKMSCNTDPYFSVEHKGSLGTKIAPGMASVYSIKFVPMENRDYEYQLTFATDSETFNVPVVAIGPRPILDFPDIIKIPSTAVKVISLKTILVRNVSEVAAVFSLFSDNPKFSVNPCMGLVEKNDTVQFTISFVSDKIGDFEANLLLRYEIGETIGMSLKSSAINANVRLDRGSLRLEETYFGLSRSKNFTIHNRSDYIVKFHWMQYKDKESDEKRKTEYARIFEIVKSVETLRCMDLIHYNICQAEVHEYICHRIYADEIVQLQSCTFDYKHSCFKLSPMSGEIWPQSSIDVLLIFDPDEIGEITSVAYLEIDGREDRIPINFTGICIGPTFCLNIVTADVGSIFLCSVHNYEIICVNQGFIPGTLIYRSKPTDFGGKIEVTPACLKLQPEEHKSFNVAFSSKKTGEFVERIDFVVKESLETISMYIKGNVIRPTLHFDKDCLDFGVTAVGFTTKHEVCLHNQSLVPVTFQMNVLGDGSHSAISYHDFATSINKPKLEARPREFNIFPKRGVVMAHNFLRAKVAYTPNIVKYGQTAIQVDMWDSDSDPVMLPITFRGKVATLVVTPAEITIRFCFINFPYTRTITIGNTSDVEGYFYIIPQSLGTSTTMLYSLSIYQGYLKPLQSKNLTITITTSALGRQQTHLYLLTFGEENPTVCCSLICNGQGPVVSVKPRHLDFGEVLLLRKVTLPLMLISDSPIPASYRVSINRKKSPWTIRPTSGELESNQQVELHVTIFLTDSGKYSDKISIMITNSRTITVHVTATGIGTSIECNPLIFPSYDMGLLFSHENVNIPITITNKGTRNHQLIWSNTSDLRVLPKGRIEPPVYEKFSIVPYMVNLPPGNSATVRCKISWEENETVKEDWYLHALIEGQGRREVIGNGTFTVTFIEPRISFSKKQLYFRMDLCSKGDKIQEIDDLEVTNRSQLNLNACINVDPPFKIINEKEELTNSMCVLLEDYVPIQIRVLFSFKDVNVGFTEPQTFQGYLKFDYDGHPTKDKIKCIAEINYPRVLPIPRNINLSCVLGCSTEKLLKLRNDTPISVYYEFQWIEESISVTKHVADTEISESLENCENVSEKNEIIFEKENKNDLKNKEINQQSVQLCDSNVTKTIMETDISWQEVKDLLLPIIDKYFIEDTEIPILDVLSQEPPPTEFINEVLDIVPWKGQVPPHSSQYISIAFHGLTAMKIDANIVCNVHRGPSEIIKIQAVSDAIKFSIDKKTIDFGQKIFSETCQETLTVKNESMIKFTYRVSKAVESPIIVQPEFGTIDLQATVELLVSYQPRIPGSFRDSFEIEVGHLTNISINIEGFASLPQVYLKLPRENIFNDNNQEFEYQAISTITTEFLSQIHKGNLHEIESTVSQSNIEDSEIEINNLLANGWEIISYPKIFPTALDINMAIDRTLAQKFIKENIYLIKDYNVTNKKCVIPYLYTPEYIIDMGYVIINQATHYSALLFNYGPTSVQVKIKRLPKKDPFHKSGIAFHFRDQTHLPAGEYTTLHITFLPLPSRYNDRITEIRHRIYFEVTYGCTMPVAILSTVTYPYISVNTNSLDFGKVIVGDCLMIPLAITNIGLVESFWEIKLSTGKKTREECPFIVYYKEDRYAPEQSGIINVYFKPIKSATVEAKLNIIVHQSLEQPTIILTGIGIQHTIKISQSKIIFPAIIPFSKIEDITFTIENIGQCPVEFYWHHLDKEFLTNDRISRVLTHYYGTNEILLPPRRTGEPLPRHFLTFYGTLIQDMATALNEARRLQELENSKSETTIDTEQDIKEILENSKEIKDKIKKIKSSPDSRKSFNRRATDILNSFSSMQDVPFLDTDDPDEIENLVHCYIDEQQKMADFHEKMKDPVKNMFDSIEERTTSVSINHPVSKMKLLMIFHGAPFTEYQRAAYRCARILQIPVLNLDKAFLEIIALGSDTCASKLRETVDFSYNELIQKLEQRKDLSAANKETAMDSSRYATTIESIKSISPRIKEDPAEKAMIKIYTDPNPAEEFLKIPSPNDIENIQNSLTKYEYKVEAILLMQKILARPTTGKNKSARTEKPGNTFLNIDKEILIEALSKRISMLDFENGFVLVTLKNDFLKNELETLSIILKIVGNVKFPIFISFYNDMKIYERKNNELLRQRKEKQDAELERKLQEMEEMSQNSFDLLLEEDRKLYAEKILTAKRLQSKMKMDQLRQAMSTNKLKEMKSKDKTIKGNKSKLSQAATRDKKISNQPKTMSDKETSPKKGADKKSSPKKIHQLPEDINQVRIGMQDYQNNLTAIKLILEDWNPTISSNIDFVTPKSKPKSKSVKSKDTSIADDDKEDGKQFFIWILRSDDPWSNRMYDVLSTQVAQNDSMKKALTNVIPTPDMRPKEFSILKSKNRRLRPLIFEDTFKLSSVSQVEENPESAIASSISIQESQTEGIEMPLAGNRRKSRKSKSKFRSASKVGLDNELFKKFSEITEEPMKSRWILQPGELQKFRIQFYPKTSGNYMQEYILTVADAESNHFIQVEGICDLPRIRMDPQYLFTKIPKNNSNEFNDLTFFKDTDTFDFGSLLLSRKDKKPHRQSTIFTLANISKIDANLSISLMDGNHDAFSFDPTDLFIRSGQLGTIDATATATKLGTNFDKLILCIKDNPAVNIIQLRCNGTNLNIELEGKQVSFEKILLYRKDTRIVTIKNQSYVPIYWRIVTHVPVDEQITLSPQNGMTKPFQDSHVEFCYHAQTVGVIEKCSMTFHAYIYPDDDDPVFTDSIVISGETYDVQVDVSSANPINFHSVKVGEKTKGSFTIKNRGPYEIKFVIHVEKDKILEKYNPHLSKYLREDLLIVPVSGSVLPDKGTTVLVTFIPRIEIVLKEAPLLMCHLVDTNKYISVVAELPLTISVISYYVRYEIYPYPKLDFGSISIYTKKTMCLNIKNTCKFPLKYSITNVLEMPLSLTPLLKKDKKLLNKDDDTISRKDKKSPKTGKTTAKTIEIVPFKIGAFTFSKNGGDIDVGQTDTLSIDCYPEENGHLQENILINVPNSVPEEKNGKKLILKVNSCIPKIDFDDLKSIFHENHIVDNIQDFISPKEMEEHTIFACQEKRLYFRRVNVAKTHKTFLKLYNPGMVPADVEIVMRLGELNSKNGKKDIFSVDPLKDTVPPMNSKLFTVSFTPHLIQTYSGAFDILVDLPQILKGPGLTINLSGEGCVPEVILLHPVPHSKRETAIINFGRILMHESACKPLEFQNVGSVEARIIIEVHEDPESLYTIEYPQPTAQSTKLWDFPDGSTDHCTICRLIPDQSARINVTFSPKDVGKFEGQIKLFIIDNPYENILVDLRGEGYMEIIVLEGLELSDTHEILPTKINSLEYSQKSNKGASTKAHKIISPSIQSAVHPGQANIALTYKLDYGACHLNKMYRCNFRISNRSKDQNFRFEWSAHSNLVFTPTTGHLIRNSSKSILATFLASEPINLTQTSLECVIHEIHSTESQDDVSWDDRQTSVQWIRDNEFVNDQSVLSKKILRSTDEPIHEIVPGTYRIIQVLLNAIAGYSAYSCDVSDINFKDTMIFQTREHKFVLTNPGIVDAEYTWKITMDEQYPIRVESTVTALIEKIKSYKDSNCKLKSKSLMNSPYGEDEKGHDLCRPLPSNEKLIDVQPNSPSYEASDLFSSTAALTDRSTDSWLEGDVSPFEINPKNGILRAEQSQEFTLKFSPLDVFDYKAYLSCNIENLDPKLNPLDIPILARSLLPYCHFEVPESDYLTSGRRNPDRKGPIILEEIIPVCQDMRVIEFQIIGIGETHMKKFDMINPTSEDYQFSWRDITFRNSEEVPYFHCQVTEGLAQRGKRTSLAFTFLAEDIGVFESFWSFTIQKYNLETIFLLVATVTEPSVHKLPLHLRMKPTIVGMKVVDRITIVNNESFPLSFRILSDSLYSAGRLQNLTVQPMSGVLQANSEKNLVVEFLPRVSGCSDFTVQCKIKKMKDPLTILITTTAYNIKPIVSCMDQSGKVQEINPDQENCVDFGKVILNIPIVFKIEITNHENMTFYYCWDLGKDPQILQKDTYKITISHKQGYVTSQSKSSCTLTITPTKKSKIEHSIILNVNRGPSYKLILKGSAKLSSYEFNFNKYDFGPRYVLSQNPNSYSCELKFTNFEETSCVVECKFKDLPHMFAKVDQLDRAVPPKSTVSIIIFFQPLEETRYCEILTFQINSNIKKEVVITGEGILYKISLINPRDKFITLGNLQIGKSVIKKIPVVNKGRAPVHVTFDLIGKLFNYEKQYPDESCSTEQKLEIIPQEHTEPLKDVKKPIWSLPEILKIEPSSAVILEPNRQTEVILKFSPTERMKPFKDKIGVKIDSTVIPLFIIQGSCMGAEFQLDRKYVSFGTIVRGSKSEIKVILYNTGDLGSKFKWNIDKLKPHFDLSPITGYCSPGMDVIFTSTFHPTLLANNLESEATIDIEKYGRLNLRMSGNSCKIPEPLDTLRFSVEVRESQKKFLSIANDTNENWIIRPILTGSYFTAEDFTVPAKKTTACNITYEPLISAREDKPHKATIIFELPGGKPPMVYELLGSTLPPRVLASFTRQFPAKTKFVELLPVYNWLNRQESYDCKYESIGDLKADPVYTFTGNTKLDVPANGQRDYRAVFHCYKEANFHFRVTFTNIGGEYQFYELLYKVTKPEILESIKMSTAVRTKKCHSLQLDNPLKDPITYTATCSRLDITIHGIPKTVQAQSSDNIDIEFYPMLVTDTVTRLDVNSMELGIFPYELKLKATPPLPEKLIQISANLGNSTTFTIPIKNHSKRTADFAIKVDNNSFSCDKTITVAGLKEGHLNVTYEPSDLESVSANLTAASEIAGNYTYPIVGTCQLPKPQGPFMLKRGIPVNISFKNIFKDTKTFEFIPDMPDFTTKTSEETVRSKKTTNITVYYKNSPTTQDDSIDEYPVTGKLLVSCTDPALSHINWIFYLRGSND